MGFYLNPGSRNFENDINNDIYIDKTLLLSELNNKLDKSDSKYLCISRPRRFGKTQAGNMIASYYSRKADSKAIFDRFAISGQDSYLKNLNKYNVLKIDLNEFFRRTGDKDNLIQNLTNVITNDFREEYPDIDYSAIDDISSCILETYKRTQITFVIIIDEYDVLIREKVTDKVFTQYLNLLNALFKGSTISEAISLAYITGILPVVRDKVQSKLNNFDESTMLTPMKLERYFGFTTEEVKELCTQHDASFEDCKKWYDGYRLNSTDICNPSAVVKAFKNQTYSSYWSATGSYESISDYIEYNFDGVKDSVIRMMGGEKVKVDTLSFRNNLTEIKNREDVFTYLIHIGYLAYDAKNRMCYIPNYEISLEWKNAIRNNSNYSITNRIIADSEDLLQSTLNMDSTAVAKSLDQSHIHVTNNRSYNNEDGLASAIYLSYLAALNDYICFKEVTAGKGFADVIYVPLHNDRTALIFELKRNGSTGKAIEQIRNKQYFDLLEDYTGDILFVAINYDEGIKTHTAEIERFIKD